MTIKIKEVKPQIWNFKVMGGENAWKEVAYSARMSGVPPHVTEEAIFKMILRNDYTSAFEHIIIKFDIKIAKSIAPEILEHRMSSHSGFSTRYVHPNKSALELKFKEEDVYEIITPWHLIKTEKMTEEKIAQRKIFLRNIKSNLKAYETLSTSGLPRESARYILPFCQAVGIYHFTMNLRSLLNFLSLRLCVRVAPEMRSIASQLYFFLEIDLPVIKGMVGCRGFMKRACPESDVTGVRKGEQHPFYPPCLFKTPESEIYIPTQKELGQGGTFKKFDREKAIQAQEFNFRKWADWTGE
ncbi:MAG: FAD-dependent thymidylate synthase [Candidatus Pacebacteria bacterium]|nr:FAD-dependent thymidylate synthase [Candidatus Paceibacterota bacterium]